VSVNVQCFGALCICGGGDQTMAPWIAAFVESSIPLNLALPVLSQEALTPLLIQNKVIERWNGTLPQFTGGGAVPFLNLRDLGGGSSEGHSAAPGH
jgi:hypothetical protein